MKNEWIKCSERLPMDPSIDSVYDTLDVLVTDGDRVASMEFQRGHGCGKPWAAWTVYGPLHPNLVTHWMPLPEPPQ